ncbi:hypothetical protein PYW08_011878 [Mythimna loreyi]|uniref:Uncharacterized protein n=2 Tax=Mythimna loreyi TaxID=667449 RepID=A0ACC2QKN5_9NEOP|nr:hypothetical protein PYW08_011877 [Mythimna loreyi]KAJ8719703.1 hypothetical protein PYW08_011878 [Mythimna loreyi]
MTTTSCLSHHASRATPTAGLRPPPRISTTIGPVLSASSGFPRPLQGGPTICVGPPCSGPAHGALSGTRSRTFPPQRLSVLRAMCPAHLHFSDAILRAMSCLSIGH